MLATHSRCNLAAAVLALSFFTCGVGRAEEVAKPAAEDAAAKDSRPLAERLVGTWRLEDSENTGDSGILSWLKIFGGTHWIITQCDPDTGRVIFHHGGRYELEGDQLTTHTDFATQNTASMIGQSFTFKLEVDGDAYIQTGVNNSCNEVSTRAK